MTYELLIGDRSYSSWSLRGWLLFKKFDIPVSVTDTRLYEPGFSASLRPFAPARTVPVVRLPEGGIVMESLAIAETLAERHPDAGFWPEGPNARAFARGITAEMHAGFTAIRSACPMNLRCSFESFPVGDDMRPELARLETLWAAAREMASDGPWLFGRYSVADAFHAPVATRLATYSLPVSDLAQSYIDTTISDPAFLEWRRRGLQDAPQSAYDMPHPVKDWPGPE